MEGSRVPVRELAIIKSGHSSPIQRIGDALIAEVRGHPLPERMGRLAAAPTGANDVGRALPLRQLSVGPDPP